MPVSQLVDRRQADDARRIAGDPSLRGRNARPTRRRTSNDTPAKLSKRMSRRWRVVLLRAKGEILGTVEAPDAEAAKAAAAVQFELDEVQRNRIMVQELG